MCIHLHLQLFSGMCRLSIINININVLAITYSYVCDIKLNFLTLLVCKHY